MAVNSTPQLVLQAMVLHVLQLPVLAVLLQLCGLVAASMTGVAPQTSDTAQGKGRWLFASHCLHSSGDLQPLEAQKLTVWASQVLQTQPW
jgi:hypothetical protein